MNPILSDYYRVNELGLGRVCAPRPAGETGFFRFGAAPICYGHSASGVSASLENAQLYDASKNVRL
ncbi:MAG: hypothetical protein WB621_20725, partial [Candidatus Acidiferrales bacterium]